jgi:hypothetical protein
MLNVITFSVIGARLDVAGPGDGFAGDPPPPPQADVRTRDAIANAELEYRTKI